VSGERRHPLVKICGVTRPADARLALELGADLVGLNFWPGSPRRIDERAAREIAGLVHGRARLVGVFVNEPSARIAELRKALGLDLLQLHGDEPESELAAAAEHLIRVERADELELERGEDGANRARQQRANSFGSVLPSLFLVDAPRDARYGGTGEEWNWKAVSRWIAACPRPVLVAGGVRPENARRALRESGAAGIDVASGVESAPGIKDAEKMRRLFEEVRRVAT